MKIFVTEKSGQTQKLGALLAKEIAANRNNKGSTLIPRLNFRNAFIICLEGDLGSGKTTFTQGLLKGLGARGPYTSPTFVVIKHYKGEVKSQKSKIKNFENIYHIDAYRVNAGDILSLGWEEIISDKNNIVIIEWADRIKKIIPKKSLRIKFEWAGENKRRIIFK